MAGVNKCILIGRLGKDPEVRTFDNGGMVASFTMATSESYKDRTTGEKKEITDWHNVVCKNPNLVPVLQKYVSKGDMLYVEGKLRTRSWEKDGKTNYITEIVMDSMTLLTPKASRQGSDGPTDDAPQGEITDDNQDLPF